MIDIPRISSHMNANFASATAWAGDKYIYVHPKSEMGDPNYADKIGYELLLIHPEGYLVYKLTDYAKWQRWKKDQKS